jgi:enoyl-[acyl-carrier protein] reductase I
VEPLAASVGSSLCVDLDVTDEASMDAGFAEIAKAWDRMDFLIHAIAFADKDELAADFRFRDTSRENFVNSMLISCYSFMDAARRSSALMTEGGSMVTLTFEGSKRVMPCYNVMGVAKSGLETAVRYLANDMGPEGIRVNAISPGPMKTLAGSAIGAARRTYKHAEMNAPLRANATQEAIGGTAVYLCSDQSASTTGQVILVDGGYNIMGMPTVENL